MASPAAVAVPSANLFGDNDSLVAMEEESEDECNEEKDDIHNPKSPGGLEHGAVLVDVEGP